MGISIQNNYRGIKTQSRIALVERNNMASSVGNLSRGCTDDLGQYSNGSTTWSNFYNILTAKDYTLYVIAMKNGNFYTQTVITRGQLETINTSTGQFDVHVGRQSNTGYSLYKLSGDLVGADLPFSVTGIMI